MIPIRYVTGDATRPIGGGTKIIAHVCNDAGAWGAGFTKALSARWPRLERRYLDWCGHGAGFFLGNVDFIQIDPYDPDDYARDSIVVAGMIAQRGLPSRHRPKVIDYEALQICLHNVSLGARNAHAITGHIPSVHMPRIGCGLAGGSWDKVEPLIVEKLCDAAIPVVVYDLPGG